MPKISKNIDFFAFVRKETPGRRCTMSVAVCVAALVIVLVLWLVFTLLKVSIGSDEAPDFTNQTGSSQAADSVSINPFTEAAAIFESERVSLTGAFEAVFASQPVDLQILSVSYARQVITLECQSGRELCGADFAALLRETQVFSHVRYEGVSRSGDRYTFTVAVTVLEEGGSAP